MFTKSIALAAELNQMYKSINRLEFKDFEDLKHEVDNFSDLVDQLQFEIWDLYSKHIEEIENLYESGNLTDEQWDALDQYYKLNEQLDDFNDWVEHFKI